MDPLPLYFHSVVKSMQFVYELVVLFILILFSRYCHHWGNPTIILKESSVGEEMLVGWLFIKALLWLFLQCKVQVTVFSETNELRVLVQ